MNDRPRTSEDFARYYSCSVRMIAALKAEGVDLRDATAVAIRLINTQSPSLPMLERVGHILDELPQTTI